MASLYKKPKSRFWWVSWIDPMTKKQRRASTKCLISDRRHYVKAVQIQSKHSINEARGKAQSSGHPFQDWVIRYLETLPLDPSSIKRYLTIWNTVSCYLLFCKISDPNEVTRELCLQYVSWRKGLVHLNSTSDAGKKVAMNTIILELKIFGKIMQEAANREYILFNPCSRLKLRKEPPRVKDEMTDEKLQIIRDEISKMVENAQTPKEKAIADFLETSFDIARMQGIRMSETYLRLDNVSIDRLIIRVRGKGNKHEDVNLNPNLAPLFKRLADEGREYTYIRPENPGLIWHKFFEKIRAKYNGFKNISFHSTRVTVISRMERAGVPEAAMMQTVLHSSTTVHRGYRRVKPSELKWNALNPSPSPEDRRPSLETQGEQPANHKKLSP